MMVLVMNKLLFLIFLCVIIANTNKDSDILKQIQKNALVIKNNKNNPNDKNILQAKKFENNGSYNEAISLYKEVNNTSPGINKYFRPLKNILRQAGALDTLLVLTGGL